jgi:hypothetical protein
MGTNTKSSYKMNEFSCYDCMKPIKTRKQLCNHLNGRGHRNVVDFRERTEEGYVPDRGRSPFGVALPSRRHGQEAQTATEILEPDEMRDADYQDWFDECGFRDDHGRPVSGRIAPPSQGRPTLRRHEYHTGRGGPLTSRELRGKHTSHRALRVNEYCGPEPDCDSLNYDQEPPDDPCMGMYNSLIIPTYELGSVASTINGEGKILHELPREYPIKLKMLKDG